MFYLNTIEHLLLFVEHLDQLEVCLPYCRLLTGIPITNTGGIPKLSWNSNKTSVVDTKDLRVVKDHWLIVFIFTYIF